jgi:hypothetical protein
MRARLVASALLALVSAPAFADTEVWECKVERRIDSGHTTMYEEGQRASSKLRMDFALDAKANKGCLMDVGSDSKCAVVYTGAGENGGIVRLDMKAPDNMLDLVNIFAKTGSFVRIHGETQWMGKTGDCVKAAARKVKLP